MLASWTDEWMNTGGKALSTRSRQYHAGLPMRGACSFYKPHWTQRGKGKKMSTGEKVGRRWDGWLFLEHRLRTGYLIAFIFFT